MNSTIDVLIVEDSPLFAEAIREILEDDPGFRVVGWASHGREAVEMTERLRPQVITMDVHMPVMGGLDAIEHIMADQPTPILVVTSDPHASPGEELHFEALRRGALDVFPKPTQWPGTREEQEGLRRQIRLISRVAVVRHLAGHRHRWRRAGGEPVVAVPEREVVVDAPPPSVRELRQRDVAGQLVAIAASTGGPAAIARIFEALPASFPAPIVVVQHIADGFTESFASWLNDVAAIDVRLGSDGMALKAGVAIIAPDNRNMLVSGDGTVIVEKTAAVDGHRPSATVLFQSLARTYGRRGVGVILTGMGRDGVDGLEELRRVGGITVAQDEETSVVFGMPRAALESGAAKFSLALPQIADHLCEMVGQRRCGADG